MPLHLPQVTLFAATSIALDATVSALRASMAEASFGRVVLFSDACPPGLETIGIERCPIEPIRSKADYSRFMLHELGHHIATSHALCVQWDGFVLNGRAWHPEFLHFDYIGAVWPQFTDGYNVGNGGFSLRSKRLLTATAGFGFDGSFPEDVLIGRIHRGRLEAAGFSFAPEPVARRFSYERGATSGETFGFHGAFNLVKRLSAREAFRLLKSLEPQVLTHNEHKELLRWSAQSGYPAIALLLTGRMLRQKLSGY